MFFISYQRPIYMIIHVNSDGTLVLPFQSPILTHQYPICMLIHVNADGKLVWYKNAP